MKSKRTNIIHPFLFATFPIITLVAHNIEEIKLDVSYRALIIALASVFLLLGITYLLTKSWDKSAFITTLTLIAFFSYGHIYHLLRQFLPDGLIIIRHRTLLPFYLFIYILGILGILYKIQRPFKVHQFLNIIGIISFIIPSIQIAYYNINTQFTKNSTNPSTTNTLSLPSDNKPPDIYYIILDAYSRDDVLQDFYHFENSYFLSQLSEMGFYIATCSQSNYAQTQLSMVSSLNFEYLENLSDIYQPNNTSRAGLSELILHNRSRQELERLGYTTYAFQTGFKTTEWQDTDYFLEPNNLSGIFTIFGGMTNFELMLIRNSAGLIIKDSAIYLPSIITPDFDNPLRIHRERILFTLSELENLPDKATPKYVFAHLVIPHPPYVFGADGEFTNYEVDDDPGYINQIIYINTRLIPILQSIIKRSTTPPIIILQADHGGINTSPEERTKILSAYFFPNFDYDLLYPQITPVNTFRIIFNHYFSGSLRLLEDISYFSVYKNPYDYSIINDKRIDCTQY